jgi:hypothetical protein
VASLAQVVGGGTYVFVERETSLGLLRMRPTVCGRCPPEFPRPDRSQQTRREAILSPLIVARSSSQQTRATSPLRTYTPLRRLTPTGQRWAPSRP